MRKFKCDLCEGECELTINICDMEDQLPFRCPCSDIEARFSEVESLQPDVKADFCEHGEWETSGKNIICSTCAAIIK